MATSEIDICNQALMMLGAKPITSLTEGTNRANLCAQLYPQIRDTVLRAHPWNCAIVRKVIAADSPGPDFGWNYSYTLPTEPYCLRVLSLGEDDPEAIYEIEGRKIMTDESKVNLVYIRQMTDVANMDSLLVAAIAARLAAELAYPVTENPGTAEVMLKAYKDKLDEARSIDSQEGSTRQTDSMDLVNVRRQGSGGFRDITVVP